MSLASALPDPAVTAARAIRPISERKRQADLMAGLVAEGMSIYAAGQQLGLTRGQAVSTWRRICAGLGEWAS